MNKLANMKGVRALNRMEQKSINGGGGATMTCKDGKVYEASSCSDCAMNHWCGGSHGGAVICVGPPME